MMDKSTDKEGRDEAFRRLKNRLKFGTEGALFNLAIIGAGKFKKLEKLIQKVLMNMLQDLLQEQFKKLD